jgi:deoxyribose-phosphate aldolase
MALEQALELVEAGASRLGTSRGVVLMQALRT